MGIALYQHNQKAYEAAAAMMEEEGKAAVIHPTGTGKSFIAFRMAMDHPEAKILWLAPSEYIYVSQLENLKKAMPEGENLSLPNIRFCTYSRLVKNKNLVKEAEPDYIVLDEFHRCGAPEWGRGVRELLERYPQAKLLGLSATNIRYLDGQRDMAQEIFEGNIASEMTLGEAIASGILKAPRYVMALYSYEKELAELEQKVEKQRKKRQQKRPDNQQDGQPQRKQSGSKRDEGTQESQPQGRQDSRSQGRQESQPQGREEGQPDTKQDSREAERLLEQLRRALGSASGPDEIFRKHMKESHGKYIVFCADRQHMDEARSHAGEWFRHVDTAPHIYTAYYNDSGTEKEFAAFREDKSEHLKLLYCIDMLNEGVHVEGVDGVILLRPTVSPILYLQQIGRSLSAGNGRKPVIFDLVNNLEGLCCIDYLKEELEEAVSLMPCVNREKNSFAGKFRIIDETGDSRKLFMQLQKRLGAAWDDYYLAAKSYYRENGNLRIPKNYETSSGLSLGSWIQTQRKVHAGKAAGNLTEERTVLLEAIGMEWSLKDAGWERGYGELAAYYEKYGNADVKARYVSESGFALGKWVSNLRGSVKKKGISKALNQEQQKQLEALGMVWDKRDERWETYLKAAREYRERNGNLKVPAGYVTEDGIALGNWLHCLKHGKVGDKNRAEMLTKEQKEQLDALGMEWEREGDLLWNRKFILAKAYYEQNGNLNMPVSYCAEGIRLGRWISNIRAKRKNPASSGMVLNEERIRQLDSIGMDWK